MIAKYAGKCGCCGDRFEVGDEVIYDRETRTCYIPDHEGVQEDPDLKALADKLGYE